MTPQFGMFGKLTTAPEDRDALIDILTEGSQNMIDMAGCHTYIISKDTNDPGAVWVFELWDTKEAHDASLTRPAVRELISRAMPMLTGQPEGFTVVPVSGKGL
jgi:quinol monooxygenase YgiN